MKKIKIQNPDSQTGGAPLLTVPQAAALLNMSVRTVQRKIGSGALRAFKDGKLVRIRPDDLAAYIAARIT